MVDGIHRRIWAIKLGGPKQFCSFWSKLGLTRGIFMKNNTPKRSHFSLFFPNFAPCWGCPLAPFFVAPKFLCEQQPNYFVEIHFSIVLGKSASYAIVWCINVLVSCHKMIDWMPLWNTIRSISHLKNQLTVSKLRN